ncbi:MAG TPA: serine hydrolase domain-containing protein [Dehalococcoidia bacterium]|nr:serine hydrolase domain-containing protein [Dehalococcoidia bacterium]
MTTAVEVHGTCDPRFSRLRDVFADNFSKHGEVGASLAVMVDGEMVVDLWGGHADAARTRPWERDTIVNTFSTTKGIVATCAHRLVDQGKLDIDAPVAQYWPEFAQAGKDKIPVRYLLSHQAGLPAPRNFLPPGAGYVWEPLRDALAEAEPWWEPGTRHGYHAVTFGHLVGEVIRRVSGMSVGQYFRKEIAEPFGIDFMIGFGPEEDARTAEIIPAPMPALDSNNPLTKVFMDPNSMNFRAFMISMDTILDSGYMNKREWRAAEIPAANGHGNARALARLYGALARGGEVDGFRVLSEATIEAATEEQAYGEDAIIMLPSRMGLGYMLDIPEMQISPSGRLFGHAGMGGSFGYADPEKRMGIGYAMNKMIMSPELVDPRWQAMFEAAYGAL